ncbi:hypothetical protein D9M69_625290 [compost metagenome]
MQQAFGIAPPGIGLRLQRVHAAEVGEGDRQVGKGGQLDEATGTATEAFHQRGGTAAGEQRDIGTGIDQQRVLGA